MSALDKFYDFTLNLPDAKLTSKTMSLCNIDRNVFNIYLTLQEGKSNPILNADLSKYTVTMIVVKPKTKEYVEKVGVIDGSNDRLLFELGETFNDQIGSYKGEIKVQNGDEVITSSSFAYTVTQSLISGLNAEIEANPDVEILRQLINEVKAAVGMTPEDPDSLLTDYQKKTDETLTTTDKTIVGAINELKTNSENIKGHTHTNKIALDKITDEKITSWDSKAEGSHNHDTVYAKKSEIPIVDVTKQYVDDELSKKSPLHEHPYLPNTTKIPTKVSELINDSNFATETFVTTKVEEAKLNGAGGTSSVKSIKDFGAKCDGVTDDTMSFESALSSDSSVIKIPKGTTLIRQGQSYISYGVKKKIIGEEGSIIKCDFDSCKHFLNLSINVEFENVTFDFNNKNILNAITFSKNVGLIRMKNVTFQNVNDTDSTKSTVIVNITDGEVDIDNVKFKNMKKRGNSSITDGGGNLTGLGYFPATERKGQIRNIVVNDAHNVNAEGQIIFEDVSGVYIAGDATNKDILIVENIGGTNFGKRLVKTQCSNVHMKNVYGFSDVGDSLSCIGVADISVDGDNIIKHGNIIVENFIAMGKILSPIATSCKNVIFRNGFIDTDYCDMPGNTGGSRAFAVSGSDVLFDNVIARTNVIGFIDNHPVNSLKDVSGKNISLNNCSFTVKDATQVYGITTSYGKEAKLDNIKINNVDIIYGSAKMGIIDFSRGVFNNIDIDNLNVEYPNADANFSANGIILDKCNNTNIGKINFKSNSVKGLFEGIKANQCTNLTIDNVATDQNDPENKCRLLNIQNSTGVSVSNIKKGNYKYLAFNTCQDVFLSDVDSSKISNINSSINMGGSGSGTGLTTEQVQQLQQSYTHSTSLHAPSNAQKNSDITKGEIEAKLIGNITTHTHSQYLTQHQSLIDYAKKTEIPNRMSQLQNDASYAKESSIDTKISARLGDIKIKKLTKQEYDSIGSKDPNCLYIIIKTM